MAMRSSSTPGRERRESHAARRRARSTSRPATQVNLDLSDTGRLGSEPEPAGDGGTNGFRAEHTLLAQTLLPTETQFRALIENSWEALGMLAADGTILYAAPSAVRVLGYPREELL